MIIEFLFLLLPAEILDGSNIGKNNPEASQLQNPQVRLSKIYEVNKYHR